MARYAALLRGINVGPYKRVSMADLRSLLSGLGFTGVATLLQSGNAVLTSADPPGAVADQIETGIRDKLGLSVRCLLRTGDQLRSVIEGNPLTDVATNGSRMMALFLSATPDPRLLATYDPRALDPERIRVGDQVIYQWCPDGILESPPAGAFVEKHLKVAVTARNWNTVTKLAAMLEK